MLLDFCNSTSELESETVSYFNTSVCEVKDVIPPVNKYLDVSSPLQLGGMSHPSLDPLQFGWDYHPNGESFKGSIRNLMHNGKVIYLLILALGWFLIFNFVVNRFTIWLNVKFFNRSGRCGVGNKAVLLARSNFLSSFQKSFHGKWKFGND